MSKALDKARRAIEARLPKGAHRSQHTALLGDPRHWEPELDDEDVRLIFARATPEGWELRDCAREGERYRCRWERVECSATPPFDADAVATEHALLDGEWPAVAASLGVSYRELRRWLATPAFESLALMWEPERARIELRERGVRTDDGRAEYTATRLCSDVVALSELALDPRVRETAEAMLRQVKGGREYPPVAVLRRYRDTGNSALLAYLASKGWA